MSEIVKQYSNGEVTIVWRPALCIHSRICWQKAESLPEVFNPSEKPWIKPNAASTDRIIEQVNRCPSGALGFFLNQEQMSPPNKEAKKVNTLVEVLPNGPLLVHGNISIKDKAGNETEKSEVTALCRCGQSTNKPYCDGSHVISNFQDA